jgi:hypothetical protein
MQELTPLIDTLFERDESDFMGSSLLPVLEEQKAKTA